jgi:quercetin dioxygenase-like cupin family protein
MTKHLIIGNGVAGTTAAQTIRKNNPDDSIFIVTKESVPFYSRIRLPDVVAGIAAKSDLIIKKDQWYKDNKINLHTGVAIVDIDHLKKQAKDQTGKIWEYDSLLLATGSNPFVPPIDGSTKTNVFTLRSLEHADNILKAAGNAKNAVAIGGGLLGLEAAHALIKKGLDVTIVDLFQKNDGQKVVIRKEDRIHAEFHRSKTKIEIIVPQLPNKLMDARIATIYPGGDSEGDYRHPGEEFGLILKGRLELTIDGDIYELNEGDSFYFSSNRNHRFRNPGKKDTMVVWVNTPSSW